MQALQVPPEEVMCSIGVCEIELQFFIIVLCPKDEDCMTCSLQNMSASNECRE